MQLLHLYRYHVIGDKKKRARSTLTCMHTKIKLLITLRELIRVSQRKCVMDTALSKSSADLSPTILGSKEEVGLEPSSTSSSPSSKMGEGQSTGRKLSVSMDAQKDGTSKPSKVVNPPPVPQYFFEGGLRRVPPYEFSYNTYCKERWRGKPVLEVFSTEFRDRPLEYYVCSFPPPPQFPLYHFEHWLMGYLANLNLEISDRKRLHKHSSEG